MKLIKELKKHIERLERHAAALSIKPESCSTDLTQGELKEIVSVIEKQQVDVLSACGGFIGAMELTRKALKCIRDALKGGMAHSRKHLEGALPQLESEMKRRRLNHQGPAHINSNVRMFDLVRYMRSELHEANLITDDEYSWLCSEAELATSPEGGSPSRQRLEDYDELRAKLDATHPTNQQPTPAAATAPTHLGDTTETNMKTKRVFRYYCEHCKKSGCSKYWMQRHDDSCIHNPNRICRFHSHIEESEEEKVQQLPYLIAHVLGGSLNALREAAMGCPACMLAAITQSGRNDSPADEDGYGAQNEFQAWRYKDEKAQFWNDRQQNSNP